MKQVVMVDNYDSFTYLLVDYFKQASHAEGLAVTVVKNDVSIEAISAREPDLIVYSPGPGNPSQAGNLLEFVEHFSQPEFVIPQFGVCLGMQAMVEQAGGTLQVLSQPLHGKTSEVEYIESINHQPNLLFNTLPNPCTVGRYHSLAVQDMPNNYVVTAVTGDVPMAIQHNVLPLYGVQFHPESILTTQHNAGLTLIQNVCASL